MRFVLVFLLFFVCFSCKKAIKVNPEFEGRWVGYEHANKRYLLGIGKRFEGSFVIKDSLGNDQKWTSDVRRPYVIKNDKIQYGWAGMDEQRFHIDQYPTAASTEIIYEFDTLFPGDTYMILDGMYFKRNN
jgi:hypothetical protein